MYEDRRNGCGAAGFRKAVAEENTATRLLEAEECGGWSVRLGENIGEK